LWVAFINKGAEGKEESISSLLIKQFLPQEDII
jgi:hypothetical protein